MMARNLRMKKVQFSKKHSICKILPVGLSVGFGSISVDIIPSRVSVLFALLLLVFSKVLDKEGLRGRKRRRVQELLDRFFLYYGQGTLSEHRRELMDDPYYDQMIGALWDYNYGPWIKEMIETTKYSGRKLEVSW